MFRFSSFATKGKSKLFAFTKARAFSSTYEAHLTEQQLLRVNQNVLDILLWVRWIGIIEFTDFAIRHIEYIKNLKPK
jgi:hypothetical protein